MITRGQLIARGSAAAAAVLAAAFFFVQSDLNGLQKPDEETSYGTVEEQQTALSLLNAEALEAAKMLRDNYESGQPFPADLNQANSVLDLSTDQELVLWENYGNTVSFCLAEPAKGTWLRYDMRKGVAGSGMGQDPGSFPDVCKEPLEVAPVPSGSPSSLPSPSPAE